MDAVRGTPTGLLADALEGGGVRHAFFTRAGGVSTGLYASLNCGLGSDDERACVLENRARAAAAFGRPPEALVTAYQIHSREAVTVDAPWKNEDRPHADALATRTPGIVLGVLTADCTPVLFADAQAGVVGVAHAGWRGARAGILDATVEAMTTLGARAGCIAAAIGPTIAQASYEVGPEFPAPFLEESAENGRFFIGSSRAGHHMFDLPGYVRSKLEGLGLGRLADLGRDTCAEEADFFSYRRATLCREDRFGTSLSAIMLTG